MESLITFKSNAWYTKELELNMHYGNILKVIPESKLWIKSGSL